MLGASLSVSSLWAAEKLVSAVVRLRLSSARDCGLQGEAD